MAVKRLERITGEARKLRFDRALLTIVLAPLYLVGWLAGKSFQVVAYSFAAVKVGWREGAN